MHKLELLPPTNVDAFTRLGLAIAFELDQQKLEENYAELQQKTHPDKFVAADQVTQALAFKHNLLINEAYNLLGNDLTRAEYILKLHGIIVNQDGPEAVKPNLMLLEEILEIRSAIDESSDPAQLKNFATENQATQQATLKIITENFQAKDFTKMAEQVIKLKYLVKIAEDLKLKQARI